MSRRMISAGLVVLAALPLAGCETVSAPFFNPSALATPAPGQPVAPVEEPKMAPAVKPDIEKARQHFRDRNFGFAEQTFRAVVESDPKNADGWLGLGASYDELRRFDLADRAYGQLLKLTGPTPQLLNNRGYSHMLRGDYRSARRDLMEARAKDPGNPHVARNIALLAGR